ncbi:hypothetical protein Rsub_01520 [Raphidocelis subcapitata]|uniref:DNA replication complex GINS protein PSF1 C-terminal domain-containing protein n=1 Tax=Raphidocelis subcapitata TaxID=307507 RepID=A0A2V0NN83_9CHLO|nr:hypothetical protein Rsub_01520 [Raphidocelis subcapitata]|eukprot:GBF89021.1 hypothetical protein Rsub_01520 [Raphidocelis subcapitata]
MAGLTNEATGLIKEMINADGALPSYNEDLVTRTLNMTNEYSAALGNIMREARALQEQEQGDEAGSSGRGVDWAQYPEAAAAVVIYHELIMKVKRILLVYLKMRADVICDMRWEQRRCPKDLSVLQEKQFAEAYDRALNNYMGFGDAGIRMDLTTDLHPPKDACVKVRVLRSHGSMALSHSAKVSLVKGSVHNMQCSEAEPLIRKGVLQVLDANC